ncbi:DUF6438 domain-containing protein [Sphingomonas sp. RS6]
MRRLMVAVAGMAVLGGCIPAGRPPAGRTPASAPTPAPARPRPAPQPAPPPLAETIRYEIGPCFGACPVFAITVKPEGTGVFEGRRFTAVSGTRAFRATPAQLAAFAARLAPYRPKRGELRYEPGTKYCARPATDMPSVDIRWSGRGKADAHLYFYFGCDPAEHKAMADALGNAVDALPVAALIGERP